MGTLARALIFVTLAVPVWADATSPMNTTLCEVAKNPARFDGQMVRVWAKVLSGFEASLLMDETCGTESRVWFSYGDDRHTASPATEYALIGSLAEIKYPETLNWQTIKKPPLITGKIDSESKRLDSYLSKQFKPKRRNLCISCPLYSVTATFVGRLDVADHRLKAYRDTAGKVIGAGGEGFGHLGGWDVRLVVESVSGVAATPIDPSIYKPKK